MSEKQRDFNPNMEIIEDFYGRAKLLGNKVDWIDHEAYNWGSIYTNNKILIAYEYNGNTMDVIIYIPYGMTRTQESASLGDILKQSFPNIITFGTVKVIGGPMPNCCRLFENMNCNQLDLMQFDFSVVKDLSFAFKKAIVLNLLLPSINSNQLYKIHSLFENFFTGGKITLDINTSKVSDFRYMFSHAVIKGGLDLQNFDTSHAKTYASMFQGSTIAGLLDLTSLKHEHARTSDMLAELRPHVTEIILLTSDLLLACRLLKIKIGYSLNNPKNEYVTLRDLNSKYALIIPFKALVVMQKYLYIDNDKVYCTIPEFIKDEFNKELEH